MIYTIFTGGTIGSRVHSGGAVSTDRALGYRLIEMYRQFSGDKEHIETAQPNEILSENLETEYISKLIGAVKKALAAKPDGIIITHGTDTLLYSGAILSYVFSYVDIPILLVSSNYILSDPRANGLINYYFSVRFIKEKRGKGVFVSYCNDGGSPVFHRGNRLADHLTFSDSVHSVMGHYYGKYLCLGNEPEAWASAEYEPSEEYSVNEDNGDLFKESDAVRLSQTTGGILRIPACVGAEYPAVTDKVKAVLLGSFHSGTIGLTDALKAFLAQAESKAVPVFLTGLATDATSYETISEYEKYNIIPLYDRAPTAQYCKLWLLLSNGLPVKEYMLKCFAEEC